MGFIGTGTQGRGLLNNFLNQPDTQVLAVCDVDTTRREHHRKIVDEFYSIKQDKAYKGCAEYKEFQDLLARKDIDAVVIAAASTVNVIHDARVIAVSFQQACDGNPKGLRACSVVSLLRRDV
jgi:predicted dehydrogenase